MFEFNSNRVLSNIREATTGDLLDRVTVYRRGMEPEAIEMIEAELARRGLGPEQIAEHRDSVGEIIILPDGVAAQCHFCRAPAVTQAWGWHSLWGKLPLYLRRYYYCKDHAPQCKK